MGRAYAGILGPLAFALVIARSTVAGGGIEATMLAACAALFAFAAAGYIAGNTAEFLIDETVRTQFQQALADWNRTQAEGGNANPANSARTQAKATT
jgi:hypothetical protein